MGARDSNSMGFSLIRFSLSLVLLVLLALVVLLNLLLLLIYNSPIDPVVVDFKPSPSINNNKLQNIIKLGEGFLKEPEDLTVDKDGTFYTATRDGWIQRKRRNGDWENWKHRDSTLLLGITTAIDGGILVCDASKGLFKVTEKEGFTLLVSEVNGSPKRFANDVIQASDGTIYFTVVSTKFEFKDRFLDILESRPHGQVIRYNPITKEAVVFLENIAFANGIALSKNEDFLVICESWKYRCLRHWLKGNKKGTTETFIDNLPDGPDNINLAPDGTFWIALVQVIAEEYMFVQDYKITKHIVASSQKLIDLVDGTKKKATVVNVDSNGKILTKLDDGEGKVLTFVTSPYEFEDNLYLGSLNVEFIAKYSLHSAVE